MPSLHDVAHDGVSCTFNNRPGPGQMEWSVRAGAMDRPSRTKSHPAGSHSSSQTGGPPCWASALAFGLIGVTCTMHGRGGGGTSGSDISILWRVPPRVGSANLPHTLNRIYLRENCGRYIKSERIEYLEAHGRLFSGVSRRLFHHMIRQDRTGDTGLVKSREMTGRTTLWAKFLE
jgi:hypothetical protein